MNNTWKLAEILEILVADQAVNAPEGTAKNLVLTEALNVLNTIKKEETNG